ncbi:MAG: hypothetical protein LBK06_07335 [Planctomycetaceae bacterium]|nr:hypothetical protein [Planctomycetaceae bacterium]
MKKTDCHCEEDHKLQKIIPHLFRKSRVAQVGEPLQITDKTKRTRLAWAY